MALRRKFVAPVEAVKGGWRINLDDEPVESGFVIGPRAARPLELTMPLFVSDMSFGALSFEAKVALAQGAEEAGSAICSGEGGMLPEEQAANSRYLYELASGRFGFSLEKATELMLDVHEKGRAVVASCGREEAEMHVFRLHEHSLWATMEHDGPSS